MNFVFVQCDVPLLLESSTCLFLFHLSLEFMVYRALCLKRVSCIIGKISSRAHSPYQCSFCNFFQGMLIVEKILIQSGKKNIQESYEKKKHFENPALTPKLNFKGWATFSLCVIGHKKSLCERSWSEKSSQ